MLTGRQEYHASSVVKQVSLSFLEDPFSTGLEVLQLFGKHDQIEVDLDQATSSLNFRNSISEVFC